jgi:putative radical SAM enzyme (TIGR03279 family)
MPKLYGWVREVVPESPADLAGIQPGDLLKAINGQPVRDLVDYQFYASEEELTLGIERNGREVEALVAKASDESLGILFGEEPAPFIRICANKCVFCFIKGLPERKRPTRGQPLGMRDSLYIKDDDYRYSFLFGSFITLTNLKEADWRRLEEQRLSPLYVSVHTTNPDLRRLMVDGPRSGEIIEQIERLGEMGITCHTQLVLCPGANDGEELERSIRELAALRPVVESISVVPVGLTKYNNMISVEKLPPLRPYSQAEALEVMARVERWQHEFAAEPGAHGMPFAYLSDEWYYTTRRPFPPARHYGSYAQIENGVGMTRKLLDDWRHEKKALAQQVEQVRHGAMSDATTADSTPARRIGILTSAMAEPVMRRIAREVGQATGLETRVVVVVNQLFGPIVTVAGLLGARDTLDAIARDFADFGPHDLLLLPRVMLDNAGARFLDDVTLAEFTAQVTPRVVFAKTAAELHAAIAPLLKTQPHPQPLSHQETGVRIPPLLAGEGVRG